MFFAMQKLIIGLVIVASLSSACISTQAFHFEPAYAQARPKVTTNDITDGAVTTPKLANDAVTADKIAGVSKIIFATCNIDFGSINPRADGVADCSVPGVIAGDNVIATPNGMHDVLMFYTAVSLNDKVRFLVRNIADITIPPSPTTWSVIVFRR
jgi:hypothetical protein